MSKSSTVQKMKKPLAIFLAALMVLSAVAGMVAVFVVMANADDARLVTDKTTYTVGEPIMVTAAGTGADWVGFYRLEDGYDANQGGRPSILWYYVAQEGNTSGDTKDMLKADKNNFHDWPEYAEGIPAGDYKVVLFANDGYEELARVEITIVENNIASDQPVTLLAFDTSNPGRGPQAITSDYAIHMSMGAPFTCVSPSMPTWSKKDSKATLSIYKWAGNYEKTIATDPIASKRFDPLVDNAYNDLSFDEQPAGDYLIRIHDVEGQVGVWHMDKKVGGGFCYMDGQESGKDWEMRVTFSKTPVTPFLPTKSAADVIDGDHVAPPEYEIPADSLLNTHKVMPDTWVFTDGLGRVSLTNAEVGDPREGRTLAMFYWTWHADLAAGGAVNTTELMKKYPEAKNDYNHSAWVGTGRYCFWNEPIYGFYRTDDEWVLRRQAELLANAGVDTIFTDNTNGNMTWRSSYMALYETWDDAQKNGAVNVPKVSYLLPFGPNDGNDSQLRALYSDIYRPEKYQNLWFYWEGKPMIMAYNTNFKSQSTALDKEIYNYFTYRSGQPLYSIGSRGQHGQWGWLHTYPQAVYYGTRENVTAKQIEQMTVGVAQNHSYLTDSITAMNGENVQGRSYTSDYKDRYLKEGASASLWGYNFAEQFNYALEKDPKVIFVTGWNEWHAWRQPSPWGSTGAMVDNALVDQFDDEHSRDLEPTKGDLKDHYYYQFVNFARQYKGVNPIPAPSEKVTVDLADNAAWKKVEPYYAAYIGNTEDRDAAGYGSLKYTETSGRNDIIGAQVARDDAYVYFHVECAEDITAYTDNLWMNLYIDATGDGALDGWESFDYVLNKTAPSATTAVLEKFTGEGYASEKVADVEYKVSGRYMTVKIAKSDLGLSGDDYTINFAWTDNVHDEGNYDAYSGDILDFYISGDVAPGGRFKYSYISTSENAGSGEGETSGETDGETPVESEPETPAESGADTTAPESDPTVETPVETTAETPTDSVGGTEAGSKAETKPSDEDGCSSVVGIGAVGLLVLIGATVTVRWKKE